MKTGTLEWWFSPGALSESLRQQPAEQVVSDLYPHLHASLFRYFVVSLGRGEEADDLVQEVFMRLYEELMAGKTIRNVRSWLFAVAHNLAIDAYRRQAAEGAREGWADRVIPEPSPEERLLAEERHMRLHRAMRRLSFRERQCLELRAQGLRYREIAEVLGIRIPTVQSMLARAVEKLKEGV